MQRDYIKQRLYQYYLLTRLHRPIGIFLLLWPMLWALWIASAGRPDWLVLIVFVLGVVLMRSAGCVINDYADRDIDPQVQRTRDRPIATGAVTPREALMLFGVLCLLALGLVLLLNTLTLVLAVVALLLAVSYPFAKRYTYLPQVHLGAAFGWAVPMVFAAETNSVPQIAWLLFVATVLWATIYDTMYAMVDCNDDLRIGVKSTAILFGESDRVIISVLQVTFFVSLWLVGEQAKLGMFYDGGLLVGVGFAVYQQYLIKDRLPAQCLKAFLNNSLLGAAVFIGIVLHYAIA